MSSIVFVIYFKKCPVLQLLCQAIPFFPVVKSPHTENRRSAYAWEAGADNRYSASGAKRGYLAASDNQKSSPVLLVVILAVSQVRSKFWVFDSLVIYISFIGRKYVNFNKNFFQLLFLFLLLTALFFQLLLQLKLIYIIQLLSQLQLTATCFSVIFLFQLQLQLTEGTLL